MNGSIPEPADLCTLPVGWPDAQNEATRLSLEEWDLVILAEV